MYKTYISLCKFSQNICRDVRFDVILHKKELRMYTNLICFFALVYVVVALRKETRDILNLLSIINKILCAYVFLLINFQFFFQNIEEFLSRSSKKQS